jgi:hypothetical protein
LLGAAASDAEDGFGGGAVDEGAGKSPEFGADVVDMGRGKDAGENVTLVLIFSFWVIH